MHLGTTLRYLTNIEVRSYPKVGRQIRNSLVPDPTKFTHVFIEKQMLIRIRIRIRMQMQMQMQMLFGVCDMVCGPGAYRRNAY